MPEGGDVAGGLATRVRTPPKAAYELLRRSSARSSAGLGSSWPIPVLLWAFLEFRLSIAIPQYGGSARSSSCLHLPPPGCCCPAKRRARVTRWPLLSIGHNRQGSGLSCCDATDGLNATPTSAPPSVAPGSVLPLPHWEHGPSQTRTITAHRVR